MRNLNFRSIYFLLVLLIVTDAAANYTIISETHHVEGWAGYPWPGTDSYDLTDNIPVSGSATGIDGLGGPAEAWSSAGNFAVKAYHVGDISLR